MVREDSGCKAHVGVPWPDVQCVMRAPWGSTKSIMPPETPYQKGLKTGEQRLDDKRAGMTAGRLTSKGDHIVYCPN